MADIHAFESGMTVETGDAFFLDTNVLIAFLSPADPHHSPCTALLSYLSFKKAKMYVNEIVLSEALHALARALYAESEFESYRLEFGDPDKPWEVRRRFRNQWHDQVVKGDDRKLSLFNRRSCEMLMSVFHLCHLSPTTRTTALQGMRHAYTIPLASSDAMIVAAAEQLQVKGIISFDRDLHKISSLPIYKTTLTNEFFQKHAQRILQALDPQFAELFASEAEAAPSLEVTHVPVTHHVPTTPAKEKDTP